jgi:hypothetical protein
MSYSGDTMAFREFSEVITDESVLSDLSLLDSILGRDLLSEKFAGMVLDVEHIAPRSLLSDLARAYRVAERHGLSDWLVNKLKGLNSFLRGGEYSELLQRCVALEIAEHEFTNMAEAVAEKEVRTGGRPDWTIHTEGSEELHLEVSAISIRKLIDDLNAFGGRLPTGQIIRSHTAPLYFEAIFDDSPRKYDPAEVGGKLVAAAKADSFPAAWAHKGVHGFVDLLSHRHELPQIISDELASQRYLKSTRMMGDKLAYTLAIPVSFKSVETKIDEKKKSNKLDKLSNVWLCLFLADERLSELTQDGQTLRKLKRRIGKSAWLAGVILVDGQAGRADSRTLRYLKVTAE